jgi:peptidoglycan/LPS O-acetylase OafA/YrhL
MFLRGTNSVAEVHFWSLCVEEHFYMVAPAVILTLTRPALARTLLVVVGGVAALRWFFYSGSAGPGWVLSFMSFDAMSAGILLAMAELDGSVLGIRLEQWNVVGRVSALLCAAILIRQHIFGTELALEAVLLPAALSFACAPLFAWLWREPGTLLARALSWSPIVYLGKISYGLYLYHVFVLGLVNQAFHGPSIRVALISFVISVLVAATSWQLFEAPINRLKDRFSYGAARVARLEVAQNT